MRGRKPLPSEAELAALPADGGQEYNRLVFEASPYLLQHAWRPVDWFPWGEAAFAKARTEGKPIFLSIGYATCHWCHVMEAESFEDPDVAATLASGFVAVKVDREERPDVDHLYMTATQALTGSGGWPNTLLLTPDRKPFFAGTYIPKPQLLDLLERAASLWDADREGIEANASEIASTLTAHLEEGAAGPVGFEVLRLGAERFAAGYDSVFGGFGVAPKFPTPLRLVALIRASKRFGKPSYLRDACETLKKMRFGGIYDQLGFGIHRYSTDRSWTVPHFEKMLYDQALAAMAYVEAHAATGEAFYRKVAEEILTYVDRDLTDPFGGFHSAEDADSEGVEGKFYVWTEAELREAAGDEAFAVFETTPAGNFREPGLPMGTNVLRFDPHTELDAPTVATMRERLLAARSKRVRPIKDDKVLCDWNGLMIAAFARAGARFGEQRWVSRAAQAMGFILAHLGGAGGRLRHAFRHGRAYGDAGAMDYACVLLGLTELIQATGHGPYIKAATQVADTLIHDFWDAGEGGFYMAAAGADDLFARAKEMQEGALPSSNGVAAWALTALARLIAEPRYEQFAEQTLAAFGVLLGRAPEASASAQLALGLRDGASAVLVGDAWTGDFVSALDRLKAPYIPNLLLLPLAGPKAPDQPAFLTGLSALDGRPTVYVCHDFACERPTTELDEALRELTGSRTRRRHSEDGPFPG